MKVLKTILLSLAVAAGGCSTLDYKPSGQQALKNAQGHVIGHREYLRGAGGEEIDRVVLYRPLLGERGNVVAYEERIKGGVLLHDLNGKRIGNRFVDLRSRGTNARNNGLTIVFRPAESEHLAQLQVTQVTIEDIKQYLGIEN